MPSYRPECRAAFYSAGFVSIWRPTSVRLNEQRSFAASKFEQFVQIFLGFALAIVAGCCYMKLIPCASIVAATAVSAKIASIFIGNERKNVIV